MRLNSSHIQSLPLQIVGSTKFGRYPIISSEKVLNMISSDDWLVPYAGYYKVSNSFSRYGRGAYASYVLNRIILVCDDNVFLANPTQDLPQTVLQRIGTLETFQGNVFITENNNKEIAICDQQNLYIYNYRINTFSKISLDFTPAHISFQNGRFICAVRDQPLWRLSDLNNGVSWPNLPSYQGVFNVEGDVVVATIPVPGKSNVLLVIGRTITQVWLDVGLQRFPYKQNSYFNINYGCLNASTIADNGEFVIWLASNDKSGPTIIYTNGGPPVQISENMEGINAQLSSLKKPENSYAFMFLQDGHMFYQLTFNYDNFSYAYDFKEKKFYSVSDENQDHHIAKNVVFFNNSYYFLSYNGGSLYQFSSNFTDLDGNESPMIVVTSSLRLPDSSSFIASNLNFWIEQGQGSFSDSSPRRRQRIDLSISTDGGYMYSNDIPYILNNVATRRGKVDFWNLGYGNQFIFQFRFCGFERFVVTNGTVSIYQ